MNLRFEWRPPKHPRPKQHNRVDLDGNRKPYSVAEIRQLIREKDLYYCRKTALRAVTFFQRELIHTEGPLKDQKFKLSSWQYRIVRRTFAWKYAATHLRVVRRLFICIPRKNGKSFLVAGFAQYLLFADREPGARVVVAAGDVKQAGLLFEVVKEQINHNYKLRKLCGRPYHRSIAVRSTNSNFQVLTAKADTKHGGNLSGVLIDELHVQKNRELVDVLQTSVSARLQPLIIYITTAGVYDVNHVAWQTYDYATKVAEGIIEDLSFYPVIFEASKEDDIYDPRVWYKANPNLEVSKQLWYMESETASARHNPSYENTVKRLDFNIWTEQSIRWMAMSKWDRCAFPIDTQALIGQRCWAGIDISDTLDMTALVLVFPVRTGEFEEVVINDIPKLQEVINYKIIPHYWTPKDTLNERDEQSQRLFRQWIDKGFLNGVDGEIIDHDYIFHKLLELRDLYDIREVAYDPWNARQLSRKLEGEGFVTVETHQGFKTLGEPTKAVKVAAIAGQLAHAGHPVLRWNVSNVQVEVDPAGNEKPSKKRSTGKIDGVSALVMAMSRVILHVEASESTGKVRAW